MTCGHECMCGSEEIHDRNYQESLEDFLRNPGPPPASMSAEGVTRAQHGIEEEKKRRGIK